ncbi:hypothetical protein [Ralstonia syzygii]|uniref:hypothetical protein n=1 Tax=Ralstonia syzygii TaxID=28097 RepID=UPI00399D730C
MDPGNIVHASDTTGIVVITQIDPITVIYTLPEDTLPKVMPRLQAGDKLPVEAWDRGQTNLLAHGTLMTVDNTIDNTTGTVKLRAQFPNQNAALFPNQFVNVRMRVDTLHDQVIQPGTASAPAASQSGQGAQGGHRRHGGASAPAAAPPPKS